MSDEQSDEQWTPEEWEEIRKQRAKFAEIQRRERLEACVERVERIYRYLRHHAEEGPAEQQEFDRLERHYMRSQGVSWERITTAVGIAR